MNAMATVFDVSPFDGGWCLKIRDTGEVLFFSARRAAVSEAWHLARLWPARATVRIHPRRGGAPEVWPTDPLAGSALTLGAPS